MRTLIQKLADASVDDIASPNATALVVGAGNGTDLALLRRLGVERLILVEADPRQADLLSQRIDPTRGEQAWALAVTPQEQPNATLRVVNQPQHSSLLAPKGLTEHFQNLAVVREIVVPARSLADIVASLGLDPAGQHILVLDAPGQAAALIQGMPSALLEPFRALVVRGSTEPLYEGDMVLGDVVAALAGRGFDPVMEDAEAIFPHQSVLLARNDGAFAVLALKERIRALEQAAEEQGAQHQAQLRLLAGERDALAREADGLRAQLEAGLTEAAAAATRYAEVQALVQERTLERDVQARLAAELDGKLESVSAEAGRHNAGHQAQLHDLTQERDAQAKLAADRHEQIQALSQERDVQAKLAADRHEQIQALSQERDVQAKLAADRHAQIQALSQERDVQAKLAADRHAQIQTLSQERAAVAAKLAETQPQLVAKQREFDELSKLAGDRDAMIQKLRAEGEEQTRIASAMTSTLEYERKLSADGIAAAEARTAAAKAQVDALTAENGRLQAGLAESRNVVMLSTRMQTLREADLKDLQERYLVVYQRSEEQHKLLTKLADRLRTASGYFHQISVLQEGEASRPMLVSDPGGPSAAPSKRKPASASTSTKAASKSSPTQGRGKPKRRPGGKSRRGD